MCEQGGVAGSSTNKLDKALFGWIKKGNLGRVKVGVGN